MKLETGGVFRFVSMRSFQLGTFFRGKGLAQGDNFGPALWCTLRNSGYLKRDYKILCATKLEEDLGADFQRERERERSPYLYIRKTKEVKLLDS